LNHVSLRIEETNKVVKTSIPSTSYTDTISKPFFEMDSLLKENKESYVEASTNNHFLHIISDQIKELDTTLKGQSVTCLDQTC